MAIRSRPQTKEWDANYDSTFRPKSQLCAECNGSGYVPRPQGGAIECYECSGHGVVSKLVEEREVHTCGDGCSRDFPARCFESCPQDCPCGPRSRRQHGG